MLAATSNIPLPYAIEYSKTARTTCKKCKKQIPEDTMRMTIIDHSTHFDGTIDRWFHLHCFWTQLDRKNDDINMASIKGVDWLRWEDQEALREKIAKYKRNSASLTPEPGPEVYNMVFSQLKVEKSITNRGKCFKCSENFAKGEMKMWRKKWVHAACLFPDVFMFVDQIDQISGWEAYEEPERVRLTELLAKTIEDKKKDQKATESVSEDIQTAILIDSEREQDPEGPEPASSTSTDQQFSQNVHQLDTFTLNPSRPGSSLKREHEEKEEVTGEDALAKKRRLGREARLAKIKEDKIKKQVDRLFEYRQIFDKLSHHEKLSIMTENDQDIPEGHDPTAQLLDRLVDNALFGCPIGCPNCPDGKVVYFSARRTYVCTGYATEYSKCNYDAKNPIRTPFKMPEKLITKYKLQDVVFNTMSERLYMDDGEDVVVRNARQSAGTTSAAAVMFAAEAFDHNNYVPMKLADIGGKNKHIIKNGTVVDAKFTYADRCHVYKDDTDGTLYQATLSLTDLTLNKNSFFKIQLLKDDRREEYYVFRSWGRVGTEVGSNSYQIYTHSDDAIFAFQQHFMEKTSNEWKYRKHFRKFPGKFNYVETDFSEFEQCEENNVTPGSRSTLPNSVKDIVMSIFSVENMKSALKSFEMDINKMPLGRLSRNQINQAFAVLTELGDMLIEIPINRSKILDATNKFYTIIPHNFGMNIPEPIDSFHKVKEKNNMLNALLDIKFAYDQISGGDNKSYVSLGMDPVDVNYQKLKCAMTPLDPKSQDWKDIKEYIFNTHGTTHDVKVDLLDIHVLNREGENAKFKRDIGNRMLLWHGSGKMNFAGILGQGLRIAPPEAPVSGYMFGKGVYFADMFTKSFFYCRADVRDEAYLLLCDVAVGNPMPLYQATTISKSTLNGYNSVKGLGRECPNETGFKAHPDGYTIPMGHRKVQIEGKQGVNFNLLYNEYIVYDVDQIQLRYLVRVKMLHARHR